MQDETTAPCRVGDVHLSRVQHQADKQNFRGQPEAQGEGDQPGTTAAGGVARLSATTASVPDDRLAQQQQQRRRRHQQPPSTAVPKPDTTQQQQQGISSNTTARQQLHEVQWPQHEDVASVGNPGLTPAAAPNAPLAAHMHSAQQGATDQQQQQLPVLVDLQPQHLSETAPSLPADQQRQLRPLNRQPTAMLTEQQQQQPLSEWHDKLAGCSAAAAAASASTAAPACPPASFGHTVATATPASTFIAAAAVADSVTQTAAVAASISENALAPCRPMCWVLEPLQLQQLGQTMLLNTSLPAMGSGATHELIQGYQQLQQQQGLQRSSPAAAAAPGVVHCMRPHLQSGRSSQDGQLQLQQVPKLVPANATAAAGLDCSTAAIAQAAGQHIMVVQARPSWDGQQQHSAAANAAAKSEAGKDSKPQSAGVSGVSGVSGQTPSSEGWQQFNQQQQQCPHPIVLIPAAVSPARAQLAHTASAVRCLPQLVMLLQQQQQQPQEQQQQQLQSQGQQPCLTQQCIQHVHQHKTGSTALGVMAPNKLLLQQQQPLDSPLPLQTERQHAAQQQQQQQQHTEPQLLLHHHQQRPQQQHFELQQLPQQGLGVTAAVPVQPGNTVRLADLFSPEVMRKAQQALRQQVDAAYATGYADGMEAMRQKQASALRVSSRHAKAAAATAAVGHKRGHHHDHQSARRHKAAHQEAAVPPVAAQQREVQATSQSQQQQAVQFVQPQTLQQQQQQQVVQRCTSQEQHQTGQPRRSQQQQQQPSQCVEVPRLSGDSSAAARLGGTSPRPDQKPWNSGPEIMSGDIGVNLQQLKSFREQPETFNNPNSGSSSGVEQLGGGHSAEVAAAEVPEAAADLAEPAEVKRGSCTPDAHIPPLAAAAAARHSTAAAATDELDCRRQTAAAAAVCTVDDPISADDLLSPASLAAIDEATAAKRLQAMTDAELILLAARAISTGPISQGCRLTAPLASLQAAKQANTQQGSYDGGGGRDYTERLQQTRHAAVTDMMAASAALGQQGGQSLHQPQQQQQQSLPTCAAILDTPAAAAAGTVAAHKRGRGVDASATAAAATQIPPAAVAAAPAAAAAAQAQAAAPAAAPAAAAAVAGPAPVARLNSGLSVGSRGSAWRQMSLGSMGQLLAAAELDTDSEWQQLGSLCDSDDPAAPD